MGVPYPTSSFKMFNTGSSGNNISSSIRGAQKYDASDSVNTVTEFSNLISNAQVPLFDDRYSGNVFELSDVSGSLQWRGYPVDVSCYSCSFEEIQDPAIKSITFSCSILDPEVEFNVTSSGITSTTNGSVTITASIDDIVSAKAINIDSDEQFIGWSYSDDGSTGILSTTATNYSHTVEDNITIFAIVDLSSSISLEFCYYPDLSLNTICESCSTTKTVYFDRDLYEVNPIKDLIWYENAGLTIKSDQGYYRQRFVYTTTRGFFGSRTRITVDDTIYFVSGSIYSTPGEANIYGTCTDGFIYCS